MTGKNPSSSHGRSPRGTGALAWLARALPTGPSVGLVAVATGFGAAAYPGSAGSVGAVTITLVAIGFVGVAICRCEPNGSGRLEPASRRPVAQLPRSSQRALILLVLAIAISCTAPAFQHRTSASGTLGELITLVVAACILTVAALELLHAAARGHPAPPRSEVPTAGASAAPVEWYCSSGPLELLSTESLCREWKLSFLALRATTDALGHARVVDDRRRCLDELARRDPAGFRRWITVDAYPVAGHPENFIAGSPTPPPVSEV